MAVPLSSIRQPFGILSDSKLRSLQSAKNRQNGLLPQTPHNLKRRTPSPEISDSENVDPRGDDIGSKRKRSLFDDGNVAVKRAHTLATVPRTISRPTSAEDSLTRNTQSLTPTITPAGRSPTRISGKLDRHQARGRLVQPSLGVKNLSVSIAAALRGTVPHKKFARSRKDTPAIAEQRPKSWFFDIFEESDHVQEYRMCEWSMTQSSANLDISDDESKRQALDEPAKVDRGKENVDPNNLDDAPPQIISRATIETTHIDGEQAMKAEPTRTPLADLDAADFYGEGLTSTSVALVFDEAAPVGSCEDGGELSRAETLHEAVEQDILATKEKFTFEVNHDLRIDHADKPDIPDDQILEWTGKSITTNITSQGGNTLQGRDLLGQGEAAIDIWESESAKDENEQAEEVPHGNIVVEAGQSICLSSAGVQVS